MGLYPKMGSVAGFWVAVGRSAHPGLKTGKVRLKKWKSWRVAVGEIGVQLGWSCVAVGCSERQGWLKMDEIG